MYYKRRGEAIAAGSRKSAAGSVFDRGVAASSQEQEKRRGKDEGGRKREASFGKAAAKMANSRTLMVSEGARLETNEEPWYRR